MLSFKQSKINIQRSSLEPVCLSNDKMGHFHSVKSIYFLLSFQFCIIYGTCSKNVQVTSNSQEKIRKRRLFKKVQAFCEEKVLRCLFEVFWYAESKNQCWHAKKWRLYYQICIFPRWPPN